MGKNDYNFLRDHRCAKIQKQRTENYKISSDKIDKEISNKAKNSMEEAKKKEFELLVSGKISIASII